MKKEKILNLIKELNADALLLLNESNMHYLCNFSPSEGVIVVFKDGDCFHLVDSRYTETAMNHAKETNISVIEVNTGFVSEVKKLFETKNAKVIAFENDTITLKQFNAYKDETKCEFVGIDDKLMRIRNVKTEKEAKLLIEANKIAEKSFLELLNHVKVGKTEKELQAYFDYLMAQNGSDGVSFDTILLTGAHTSLPHGVPSDLKVKEGDFVLCDFGATYNGYHSDMTRTFAVGNATDEMEEMYNLVLKAQLAGIDSLKAGAKCSDVYQKAYDVLEEKQMGKYFRHSLGHGVGIDIHEGFSSSPRSNDIYEVGNVTSVEPGIYLPNKFGIRIEDVCIVRENGCYDMSTVDKKLLVL